MPKSLSGRHRPCKIRHSHAVARDAEGTRSCLVEMDKVESLDPTDETVAAPALEAGAAGAHDFAFTTLEGAPLPLSDFAGQAVLLVNTASCCGFTKQYGGLQALWQDYRPRGLVVLGVPSNDFGAQEPGSAEEIKDFCETGFGVDFPLAGKTRVRGPEAHPFYLWARRELGGLAAPKWNFHKFLIAPDGRLVTWFYSWTGPGSARLRRAIEAVLPPGS